MSNTFYWQNLRKPLRALMAMILILFAAACASSKKSGTKRQPIVEPTPTAEQLSQSQADIQDPTGEGIEEAPPVRLIKPAVLVFGPGLAKTFAFIGAVRAIEEAKIPVGGVVGTGYGALIAAIYARSESVNDFEWALLQLKTELFTQDSSIIGSLLQGKGWPRGLQQALENIFKHTQFEDLKKRLVISVSPERRPSSYRLVSSGRVVDAVRAAMTEPLVYPAIEYGGTQSRSAAQSYPYLVPVAREMEVGPVITFDVLDSQLSLDPPSKLHEELDYRFYRSWSLGRQAVDQSDLVIAMDLAQFHYLDFKKRTSIVFQGKIKVAEKLKKIKELVGLIDSEDSP